MKRFTSNFISIVLLISLTTLLTLFGSSILVKQPADSAAIAQSTPYNPATFAQTFTHHTANVNGVRLHYVMGGKGEPLVLLHGWSKTWYKWRKVMPALAERYTVIVPDLPGLGDSSPSTTGYGKRAIAQTIYQLVNQLGFQQINLVGHDIGGMVAYAFAATHPESVQKLVLTEFWLPGFGLEDGMDVAKGGSWHFGFHSAPKIPEILTAGKEREYLTAMGAFKPASTANAFSEADIQEYLRTYAQPDKMHAGFEYYRTLLADGRQNRELAQTKLTMPVLTLVGGEGVMGDRLQQGIQVIAKNVQSDVIPRSGHWLAEEQPKALAQRLLTFFAQGT
jgi:pimeloyl-ACP methyl ester carboxylesterase